MPWFAEKAGGLFDAAAPLTLRVVVHIRRGDIYDPRLQGLTHQARRQHVSNQRYYTALRGILEGIRHVSRDLTRPATAATTVKHASWRAEVHVVSNNESALLDGAFAALADLCTARRCSGTAMPTRC